MIPAFLAPLVSYGRKTVIVQWKSSPILLGQGSYKETELNWGPYTSQESLSLVLALVELGVVQSKRMGT